MYAMKSWAAAAVLMLGMGRAVAGEVSVAVAANFTDATRDIVPLFEAATGHSAKVSFGSTGKLYAQIENGAPFQVFLAADSRRPEKAVKDGLAVADSRFTYARGKLVLWSTRADLADRGADLLKSGDFNRVAIANPKTAPYGLAARQVMEGLGVWGALRGKVVQGDSIAQTFQFVATGNADLGFVAYSQVKAWKGAAGSLWDIPAARYPPIRQQAVLLKTGRDQPAAQAFMAFLKGEQARAVITRYGYSLE